MNITGGKFNGRKIKAPDATLARPTLSKVRMAIFNTLYSLLGNFEGRTLLDVYSGSGIIGLEALSRGFDKVVGIEKNKTVIEIIKNNYKTLGIESHLIYGDSLKVLKKLNNDFFDVVYIDPPYYSGIYEKTLNLMPNFNIGVIEHTEAINLTGYKILQTKNYGGKQITYITKADE